MRYCGHPQALIPLLHARGTAHPTQADDDDDRRGTKDRPSYRKTKRWRKTTQGGGPSGLHTAESPDSSNAPCPEVHAAQGGAAQLPPPLPGHSGGGLGSVRLVAPPSLRGEEAATLQLTSAHDEADEHAAATCSRTPPRFSAIDTNNDGEIDQEELVQAVREGKIRHSLMSAFL